MVNEGRGAVLAAEGGSFEAAAHRDAAICSRNKRSDLSGTLKKISIPRRL